MTTRLLLLASILLAACGGRTTDAAGVDASTDGAGDGANDASTDSAPDDLSACSGPGQCILSYNGCCHPCGFPSLSQYTAIHESKLSAFRAKTCTEPGFACPDCATFPNKSLVAFCTAGRCTGVDLRTHAFSSCAKDDDCVLRAADCCECEGDTARPVALSKASVSAYAAQVCKPGTACSECLPTYPGEAYCDPSTKHCAWRGPRT